MGNVSSPSFNSYSNQLEENFRQLAEETKGFKNNSNHGECSHNYLVCSSDYKLVCTDCCPTKYITEEEFPDRRAGTSFDSPNSHTFEINSPVLTYNFVDIRAAVVTSRHDEQLISRKITKAIDIAALEGASDNRDAEEGSSSSSSISHKRGADAVNRLLRVAIAAAYATSEHPLLQSAACGDQSSIQTVRSQAEQFLPLTAEGGYLTLLA
eukprot:gene27959-36839_t